MNVAPSRPHDLAALLVPLGRHLAAAEVPILATHGLTMWGYVVLCGLVDGPAASQGALADAIGADRTRIISVLDDLAERGLIARSPHATDRRVNVISLTGTGRGLQAAASREIQANEDRLLAVLAPAQRAALFEAVTTLHAALVTDADGS